MSACQVYNYKSVPRGVSHQGPEKGITSGHGTPSGPAAARAEPRICRSRSVPGTVGASVFREEVALSLTPRTYLASRAP